jgi:hypothetical protein
MNMTGRWLLVRRVLAGVLLAAASVGGLLGASANIASPHHALADNGVISSHN